MIHVSMEMIMMITDVSVVSWRGLNVSDENVASIFKVEK
jgi:hypothetical protein